MQSIFLAFAAVDLAGTALLMLPIARSGPGAASPLEAWFTSTSALCVTGLIVVDTPSYWSGFGQAVILLLIQIGGLGVMTLASVIGITVLHRLSLRAQLTTAAETRSPGIGDVGGIVRGVVGISLAIEAVVAIILAMQLAITYGESPWRAAWLGLFHSVSAFNNAGFALYRDSLMGFVADPVVCLPIAAAIILGGLGFPVIVQLRKHGLTVRLWSMNTRLVVVGTVVLLVTSTIFVTVLEWSNPRTLGGLDWPARILAGFFNAVQTRTAGFNSIDTSAMHSTTWFGMDALMFIGGGPAGTAGGIKITTFAVLLCIIVAELRGAGAVDVLGKRLSRAVHRQAIAVALIAVALIATSTMAVMLLSGLELDRVLFETTSAFGTVGLSTGITTDVTPAGQIILIVLMFIGRLGPITFASALALRERPRTFLLPKERPIIG